MQCNVLSHYFLVSRLSTSLLWTWKLTIYTKFRLLEPLLKAYKDRTSAPSRVLWTSSLEADPSSYDPNDWQLLNSEKPYDASKYQIDLLAGHLELEQQRELSAGADVPVRHLLIHPGVVRTNIATKSLNSCVLDSLMQLAFFIVRRPTGSSSMTYILFTGRLTAWDPLHMFGRRTKHLFLPFISFSLHSPLSPSPPKTHHLNPTFSTS